MLTAPAAFAQGTSVDRVAAGDEHTCALLDDGSVRCNATGFDDPQIAGAFGPVDLGNRAAVEITAGEDFTCARLDNGTVRCWGAGASNAESAVNLGEGRSAVAISAGGAHACAVLDNGKIRCWGSGGSGQLGHGNTDSIGDPGSIPPVDLGFQRTAVDVSAGGQHTCAILNNGRTLCWGSNTSGQLGYPNLQPEFAPDIGDNETPGAVGPIDFGGTEATSISAGNAQTCALLVGGTVRCWGSGLNGRLGYGDTLSRNDPADPTAVNLGGSAVEVETRDRHTCARLVGGSLRCWGLNQNGQLGDATTQSLATNPFPGLAIVFGPGLSVSDFAVGGQHNCAVLDNDEVKCWGFGEGGRLGYGDWDNVGDDETPAMAGPVDVTDDPPTAVNDSFTVDEDSAASALTVLANDTDPDLGPKQILSTSDPVNGSVAITGGGSGLTYTPDPDYCNTPGGSPDTFTYTITGGSSAMVSMTVNCVDEPAPGTGTGTGTGTGSETGSATEPDTTAPETTFAKRPKVTTKTKEKRAKLKFEFAANEAVSKFECSFDGAKYDKCATPLTLKVKRGTHTFDVRAIDLAGNVDGTPANYAFEVVKTKRKR